MTNCLVHPDIIDAAEDCSRCRQVDPVKEQLRKRVPQGEDLPGCFLCKWILLDLEMHGKLMGWNLDMFNKPIFPREGEFAHLKIEGIEFVEAVL